MLADGCLASRGRRGARAATAWALGDDGPLYCLARRGGVGAGAAGLDAFVACPAASSGEVATRLASTGERHPRPPLGPKASALQPLASCLTCGILLPADCAYWLCKPAFLVLLQSFRDSTCRILALRR